MNFRLLACALIATGLTSTAWAKNPVNPEFLQAKKELAAARKMDAAAASPTTTGDDDAYGRNVKFLGLMSTGAITLASDCTPDPSFPPGPDDHCFVLNAAPMITHFAVNDAAHIVIPAKSSNSLFCHWQTPIAYYSMRNTTGGFQPNARFIVTPSYTIENEVLNDPSLIDPNTGLPFGGSLTISLAGIRHMRSLQAGESDSESMNTTRSCIAGLISKRALIDGYGLTAAQASNFFKKDTIITMNLQGSAALVDFASIYYGTRFVGD